MRARVERRRPGGRDRRARLHGNREGLAFVAGNALVRGSGGSSFAQGIFGGVGLAGGGLGLAIVPQLEGWLDWRAAYWTSIAVALVSLVVLAAVPPQPRPARVEREDGIPRGILRDRRLYRLGVLYAASLGLSLVIGNWVVELLDRNGGVSKEAAAVIGALTLLLGILTGRSEGG